MQVYDHLPPDLRRWMAGAAMPWSPTSCLAIWRRAVAEEGSVEAALARLDNAEKAALGRDSLLPRCEGAAGNTGGDVPRQR
jgi:hypothetical protein